MILFTIFVLIAISAYRAFFYRKFLKMKSEIKNLTIYLNKLKKEANSTENKYKFYTENFEKIKSEFNKHPTIRLIWDDFRKSLTHHKDDKTEQMYSIADSSEYFSFQNFTQGMNMSFWQGYGGIFTGLGILGTFLGLTIGLNGIDMTSPDVEVLKSGIAELLSGVQSAFYTSLFGIFIAIIYMPLHNYFLSSFRKNIQNLANLIEEMFPRRTSEYWLHENYVQSSEQTTALRNIGTDVANAIYDGFEQHFDDGISRLCDQIEEKITPLFENICNSINKLGDGGAKAINETMSKLAGSQMQGFAESLNNFTNNVQKTLTDSKQVAEDMNKNILSTLEEMSKTLKVGAEDAANHQRISIEKNSATINQLIETMSKFSEQQKQILEQSANNNASQIKLATTMFQNSVSKHMQQSLTTSQQLTEAMNEKFLSALEEMRNTLKAGAEDAANHQRKSMEESVDIINSLTENMRQFAKHQEELMTRSVVSSANQIKVTTSTLQSTITKHNETMEQTYNRTESLMKNTEDVLIRMKEAIASLEQTTVPIQQSVTLLKDCLIKNELVTKQFRDEISAQITKLAMANQRSENNIEHLVTGLKEYEKNIERAWANYENNFDRVGGELERSTSVITEKLQNYNDMMNNVMTKTLQEFDNSVSRAIGLLKSSVEELQDSIADLSKKV